MAAKANEELYKQKAEVAEAHHLSLKLVLEVFNQWDPSLDMLELESLVSSLIFKKFIKGYIHQEKGLLVLNK